MKNLYRDNINEQRTGDDFVNISMLISISFKCSLLSVFLRVQNFFNFLGKQFRTGQCIPEIQNKFGNKQKTFPWFIAYKNQKPSLRKIGMLM